MIGPKVVRTEKGRVDVARVLEMVNLARVARGDAALADLPAARPEVTDSCPIARALNIEVHVQVDGDEITFDDPVAAEAAARAWRRRVDHTYQESVPTPRVMGNFIAAYDGQLLLRTHPHLYESDWLREELEGMTRDEVHSDPQFALMSEILAERGLNDGVLDSEDE